MSFLITIYVREGIVMASDSRATFNVAPREDGSAQTAASRMGIHYSDTTAKTFLLPNRAGLSVCGDASICGAPIAGYIESFIRERITADTPVDRVPDLLVEYFSAFDPIPASQFFVAGYNETADGPAQQIWNVHMKGRKKALVNKNLQGAAWAGEGDIMGRLFSELHTKKDDKYVPMPTFKVAWNFFTLQDAVDFAVFAVKTTIDTMRFQLRYKTVGGAVDVLVIKPGEASFIARKELGIK